VTRNTTAMQDQTILIDSTYGRNDAKEVLCGIISDKIQFLGKQIFTQSERLGSDAMHLKKRQTELKAELKRLVSMIDTMQEDDLVEIDCTVNIKIKSVAL
jgi:regulator of extracellular matrix RemA (YlzA/DUF370 family)